MTDTAAAPPSPWLDVLKASVPYIGQVAVIVVTFVTGYWASIYVNGKPHVVIEAADKPKPTPMVSLADVDSSLSTHCGEIKGILLERLPAPKARRPL